MDDFAKPKIVWAETMRIHRDDVSNFPRFAMATDVIYTDKTCFIGTGKSEKLKVVLGILNSKVGRYQLGSLVSKMDDGGWLMQKIYIEKVLIPNISKAHQRQIQIFPAAKCGVTMIPSSHAAAAFFPAMCCSMIFMLIQNMYIVVISTAIVIASYKNKEEEKSPCTLF